MLGRLRFSTSALRWTEAPRINPLGIQYLSHQLQSAVFPRQGPVAKQRHQTNELLLRIAQSHLKHHQLLGKKTNITTPLNIPNMPPLVGKSLDEHFWHLGTHSGHKYHEMAAKLFSGTIPSKPKEWLRQPGWVRYAPGHQPVAVDVPLENELVFDVEVLYKISNYPVMATCVSSKAWYGWVSPVLCDDKPPKKDEWAHLIPFDLMKQAKLMVGYNVSFDRACVLDEYQIAQSKAFYLDMMALHIAVSGICSRQRPKWMKHNKSKRLIEDDEDAEGFTEYAQREIMDEIDSDLADDPWLNMGSTNSLANVYHFHCGAEIDKSARDWFSSEDPADIRDNFNELMTYCAGDVEATFAVGKQLWPQFNKKLPHPVSFAALRHIGSLILPTTKKWETYLETAESIYNANRAQVSEVLEERARQLVAYVTEPNTPAPDTSDPWLAQLDWTIKQPRLKKDGTPVARQAFLTGYPQWYRDLHKAKQINITTRTRITPLLLRLKWEGYPLRWTDSNGWCFFVPSAVAPAMREKNYVTASLTDDEHLRYYDDLRPPGDNYEAFKVPHPDGASKRCTMVLSKRFLPYFGKGILTSEYGDAHDIVALNNAASYWMGNRQRIIDQWVVYTGKQGFIVPKICTMGTITRRATENTWLTASNAKKDRIGSELKSLIEAPPGYCFVGADVDSEELWIASLLGDAMLRVHGGTSLGWMTLEGDKSEGTDLHSKTAGILGISRNDAKVFNYGRIYGAGVKFATQLLKQCNPALSEKEAAEIAQKLYAETKGQVARAGAQSSGPFTRNIYHGGTESVVFNTLESIAHLDDPRTPVLGAAITDALTGKYLKKNNYITSRINWTIQSSGVDYLHLLVVAMEYLMETYKVKGRLAITVHDELRYLVQWEDRYKTALLLQVANLWTRAMFCEQVGIVDVPQSVAFFSEVDIDTVLRKEVSMDCVTPSNPVAIPPGESLDIHAILDRCELPAISRRLKKSAPYIKRPTTMALLQKELDTSPNLAAAKLSLQNSVDKKSWRHNLALHDKLRSMAPAPARKKPAPTRRPIPRPLTPTPHQIRGVGDDVDIADTAGPRTKVAPVATSKLRPFGVGSL
ncbi:DNA polymerase gamma [Diutina catenulata]